MLLLTHWNVGADRILTQAGPLFFEAARANLERLVSCRLRAALAFFPLDLIRDLAATLLCWAHVQRRFVDAIKG